MPAMSAAWDSGGGPKFLVLRKNEHVAAQSVGLNCALMFLSMRQKWLTIGLVLLSILILIRLAAPSVILSELNKKLANINDLYSIHIGDFDLSLVHMAYSFNDVEVRQIQDHHRLARVKHTDVRLSWRELLRARILADVAVSGLDITLKQIPPPLPKDAKHAAHEAKKVGEQVIPLRLNRVEIHASRVALMTLPNIPLEKQWYVDGIDGVVANINPADPRTITAFALSGKVLGSAPVRTTGKLRLGSKQKDFDVNLELRDFDLAKANTLLMNLGPLSFKKGTLIVMAEAHSQNGRIRGYVKPFFDEMEILGNKKDFVSGKHFIFDIFSALSKVIMQNSDTKSVATRVPFSYQDQKFTVDAEAALANAITHGFDEALKPQLDESVNLQ